MLVNKPTNADSNSAASPSLGSLARLLPNPPARPGSLVGLLDLYTRSGK
jgi:hypothetical protein